jgi:hypothetical protein
VDAHFTHTIKVDGVDYVLTSLPPCYVCGSSAHVKSDCPVPAAIRKAPIIGLAQAKFLVDEDPKVVEVAPQPPADQPAASTSNLTKSRKRKMDNNVDTAEVVSGHKLTVGTQTDKGKSSLHKKDLRAKQTGSDLTGN